MTTCPSCKQLTQAQDFYCSHCGKQLKETVKVPWYFRKTVLVIALLSIGPFALPLLWVNPAYSRRNKIVWSLLILIATWALGKLFAEAFSYLATQYNLPI